MFTNLMPKTFHSLLTDGLQKVTPGRPVTIVSAEEMQKLKSQEEKAENKIENNKK